MRASEAPAWYESFRQWLAEPSPLDEWLYRGQAARYGSVQPSLLREGHRQYYSIELYELGNRVVEGVLVPSPLLGPTRIHPAVITAPLDVGLTSFAASLLGTPPTMLPGVSLAEVVRALAQHYGFPTFFIDLSLDPIVAAFFAAYEYTDARYVVRASEPSVVYRWPAKRSSSARMQIPVDGSRADGVTDINAIDLTQTSRYVRRPHNQRAVLATPVSRPLGPLPVLPFATPLEDMTLVDLAELGSCESFALPAGAGFDLTRLTGVSEDGLFPDRIDLGYSCLALVAFLSLVVHHPDDGDTARGHAAAFLLKRFQDALSYAASILDHESLRLVPGFRTSRSTRASVLECATFLRVCAEDGRRAVAALDSPRVSAAAEKSRKRLVRAAREEFALRVEAWNTAVANAVEDPAARVESPARAEDVEVTWSGPGRTGSSPSSSDVTRSSMTSSPARGSYRPTRSRLPRRTIGSSTRCRTNPATRPT